MAMKKSVIERAAELGMVIQIWDDSIAWLIDNDWWEAYPGQMDKELIQAWTQQWCAWDELRGLEKKIGV